MANRVERNIIVWRVAPKGADGQPRSFRLTWSTDGRLYLTGISPKSLGGGPCFVSFICKARDFV